MHAMPIMTTGGCQEHKPSHAVFCLSVRCTKLFRWLQGPPGKSQGEESEMPPYDDATQQLIDAAEVVRNEYESASKSLREIEDTIRNLEKEISLDFGSQGEFSYLYGQCYELSTPEIWNTWAGPENDKFSAMKYDQGTGCWQGPNRSTLVKLLCGKETVVTSTSEPSRCEYLMEFYTPAACQQPAEIPQPEEHDEL
ncbi:hypothetical protein AB205_0104730 [Aquarana catesbeiana]|uniref:MRH domain-containing protein n=1 Tax=Aquarana catesbeiana TaxID=8400 RepID=A0A2G9P2F0_AQUCT|nr:hypothetical protein AB205_0104730 [Aquarana catesbeiana]